MIFYIMVTFFASTPKKVLFSSLYCCPKPTSQSMFVGTYGHAYVDQWRFSTRPPHVARLAPAANHTQGFRVSAPETRPFLPLPSSPVP